MLEKWKGAVDNKKMFGALLTDLFKGFDCFSHKLIIAKLDDYSFSLPALSFIHDYLLISILSLQNLSKSFQMTFR